MGSPQEQRTEQAQEKSHGGQANQNNSKKPPPPPEPSDDAGIVPPIKSPVLQGLDYLTLENVDIFTLDPVAALKLLCRGMQLLVDMTGDLPPTPAIEQSLANASSRPTRPHALTTPAKQSLSVPGFSSRNSDDHIDGVPFQRTPIGSPEAHPHEPIVHGSTSQPAVIQYAALVRKFYSKRPPPISLEDYLSRMHKYCPMSTAVYLATSHYISHLAVREKLCPVTPRNVHRLVLAGLRIAMKALEDLSWPHGRFAKVGGISEPELARLEVGFCFLMDFELKVDAEMLTLEVKNLVRINNNSAVADNDVVAGAMQLKLPEPRKKLMHQDVSDSKTNGQSPSRPTTAEKRKASSSLPTRPINAIGHGVGIEAT